MKVLITSGSTREPIDSVRFITNLSTGETGKVLAEFFSEAGHQVTFLFGQASAKPHQPLPTQSSARPAQPSTTPPQTSPPPQPDRPAIRCFGFETFQDLDGALKAFLAEEEFDVVIHAAAVSDYSVSQIRGGGREIQLGADFKPDFKIDSSGDLEIILKRNFKILDRIKSYSRGCHPVVVGFKLTHAPRKEEWMTAVKKLYASGAVDWVVHNDLSEREGNGAGHPRFRIFRKAGSFIEGMGEGSGGRAGESPVECASRAELASTLESLIRKEKEK